MSAKANKLEVTTQAKCNPQKYYEMIKYNLHHLPAVFPEVYKSIEILEGEPGSVGTVKLWKYVLPGTSEILVAKSKVESIDDKNKWIVLSMVEAAHADDFPSFAVKIHVIPEGEECKVKWSVEYEKSDEDASDPDDFMALFAMVSDKLGTHVAAQA